MSGNVNIVDSIFISLGLDVTEFASAFQQVQKNVGSALTVVNEFSTGLAEGITATAHNMTELIKATEKAKKELEEAGKIGSSGMEDIGNEAEKTRNTIQKTESAAKKLGKSLGTSIKSFLTNIATPLAGFFAVSSVVRSYTSDLEALDALTKKTGLSMTEQVEKQKLLSKYSKEDLQLYQDSKKALKEFGDALQEAFRPIMKIIVPALSWFSQKLLDIIKYCKEHKAFIIPLFAGIAAVIATALIPTLKSLELTATKAFIGFMRPLLPMIALVTAVALVIEDLWVFMKGGDSALGRLMVKFGATKETIENTRASVKKMFDLFQEFYPYIIGFFGTLMAKGIVFKTISIGFGAISKSIGVVTKSIRIVSKGFSFLGKIATSSIAKVLSTIKQLPTLFSMIGTFAKVGIGKAVTAIKSIIVAIRAMGAAALANPLILIITAIIAVIALCIIYWDDLKEAGASAWEWIKSAWSEASDWFSGVIESINAKFQVFKDFLQDLMPDWLKDLLGIDGGKGIDATIAEAKEKLTNMVTDLIPEGVTETLSTAGDALKHFGSNVADFFSFSTPAYALNPSSIQNATSNNTEVTTNMGGVVIEVKSTDPMRAGDNVKNELEALVTTANYGVNQK